MAKFKISGVWITSGVITHYAIHHPSENGFYKAIKTTKADAVKLVNNTANETMTWLWDYQNSSWKNGAKVEGVGDFLRSHHDGKVSDNLAHLINYEWL